MIKREVNQVHLGYNWIIQPDLNLFCSTPALQKHWDRSGTDRGRSESGAGKKRNHNGITTLKQVDYNGVFKFSEVLETENPGEYSLAQNFPNPFNPVTKISFNLPQQSVVSLKIYNSLGEEEVVLINEEKPAGSYEIDFNASSLPSGVFIYRLEAGSFTDTKKMLLIK